MIRSFRDGRCYMHKRSLDLAMDIKYNLNEQLSVQWINLGYTGKPWIVHSEKLDKSLLDLNEWHDITQFVHDRRTLPGLPQGVKV